MLFVNHILTTAHVKAGLTQRLRDWKFRITGEVATAPVAYGRVLLVARTDGTLYALNQTSGRVEWEDHLGSGIHGPPALDVADIGGVLGGVLVVTVADDGSIHVREACCESGLTKWTKKVDGGLRSSPYGRRGGVRRHAGRPGLRAGGK